MKTEKTDRFNEIIKFKYIGDAFIEEIKASDKFRKHFIAFEPNLEADIISASIHDNCSCKGRIKEYINTNLDKCVDFIVNYEIDNGIILDFDVYEKKYDREIFSGKIAKTTIKEWSSFCEELNKKNPAYNHISVTKDGDDLYVFFV